MAVTMRANLLLVVATIVIVLATVFPASRGDGGSSAPAPAPTSDGTTIDQGIAYVLMAVALVVTYLIHPYDSPFLSPYNFFQNA